MANPLKAESEVHLEDGRTLTLAFDVNAWIEIGEELGTPENPVELDEIMQRLTDKDNPPGLKFQRTVIWGGLRKHHPEMTMREAGEVMVEAAGAMNDAVSGGLPQDDGGAAGDADANPPSAKRIRGTRSTKAGAA